MRCDECKYSKVRTDQDLNMQRRCMHGNFLRSEMVPTPRGIVQLTFRPVVEDDEYCNHFEIKSGTDSTPPLPNIEIST